MYSNIPIEIIDIIADYHNYNKYCKPKHKKMFKNVLEDFNNIFNIFIGDNISPNLVYICWGSGWIKYNENNYELNIGNTYLDN